MNFPESISKLIDNRSYISDSVGMSASSVLCFEDMILKIEDTNAVSDNEHSMMRWLNGKLPVPEVLAFDRTDGRNYLLMSRLPGHMLCAPEVLRRSGLIIRLMAQACEMLWRVDISDCPMADTLDLKLSRAARRLEAGLCSTEDAEPDTYGPGGFENPEHLLRWLIDNRPDQRSVLTHGDFCLPNILTDGQSITGFIDLGLSGAGDRHTDLALGARSMLHNTNGSYGAEIYPAATPQQLYAELGITPDPELIRYYALLDELF